MHILKPKYLLLLLLLSANLVSAQFYFFGRNKVQYEDFEWKVLKTEHFNIYYYGEFEEMAEIGAQYAEEAYADLKVKFNNIISRRIPLIFYNTHIHFQQTNTTPSFIPEGVGGFFEFLKGRVVIPFLGSLPDFRHVIRHEMVHVFMMNKIYNVMRNRRLPTNKFPPLWFVEGLAEYWSTEWDTQAEMVLRDAVINNFFIDLETLPRLRGFLMYKEGQSFLEFVGEEYGEERVLMMLENIWKFSDFSKNISYTLGEPLEVIDNKWQFKLKQKYYPLFDDKRPHHIDGTKLTEQGFHLSPKFYSNGDENHLFFIGNKNGYTSIYRMELNEDYIPVEDAQIIVEGEREELFENFHFSDNSLDVSGNGTVCFVTKSGRSDVLHIYSIKKDEVIKTYRFENLLAIKAPSFSSTGNLITFSAIDRKGFTDIFVYDLLNEKLDRITNDYYQDIDPIFSPGDESIVFASDRTEGEFEKIQNIFEYDLTTKKINYLTYVDANLTNPHFSRFNNKLYFNADYDGTFNLWELERGENNRPVGMTQTTRFMTSIFDYTFVDSAEVITSGFERFSFHLYKVNFENTVDDSTVDYVSFDFANSNGKWIADKVVIESEQDRLVYENEYTLDYAVSQFATDPVYGSRGGALLTLSDMLSDDRYLFVIYNTAETQSEILKNFNVAITRINLKERTNYGYGVFHFSGRRYDLRQSDDFFRERAYGGFVTLLYPFSKFNRVEISTSVANSDKKLDTDIDGRKALMLSNTVNFVHDNSLWGPTGPIDGSRFRLLLGYTSDIKYSNVNYYSFIVDYRKYFRLTLQSAFAVRAALFVNHGKEARRYFAGGSWDLRGWPRWSIRGEKLWISSAELRFPLIDQLYIKFPFVGLGFTSIRGAVFTDFGSAWDDDYDETLGSVGVGIRINFLGAITFRYDVGKKIEDNLTRFQPKLFYQFFFGWDF